LELIKAGMAGTLESGDILIEIEKNENNGRLLFIKSPVEDLYGKKIRQVIAEVLDSYSVDNVTVKATDKGALDCTIRARMISALHRAANIVRSNWGS
jgi:citrate lyase subunit gamma (acyl carrier protein)